MPYSSNNGGGRGPWGGGGGGRGKGPWGGGGGGGDGGQQGPDLDDLLRKGRDQLRIVLGGKGGKRGGGRGNGGGGGRPNYERLVIPGIIAVLVIAWLMQSFYRVDTDQEAVELRFGKFAGIGMPGLNFAPWPVMTYDILPVQRQHVIEIGASNSGNNSDQGLMLTGDENIVDIGFQVVWKIQEPAKFLFNLAEPGPTIEAVSEAAMREVVARSKLKPILAPERAAISGEVKQVIQTTLDNYDSGVKIVQVNFKQADPPKQVIDAFRDVQAAQQDRLTETNKAQAYANKTLAAARGEVAQVSQDAEGYRARVVNEAKGDASRFDSILKEYLKAPNVTRKRLYLESMERVLGSVNKIIIDPSIEGKGGQGVVPYLPLPALHPVAGPPGSGSGKGGSKGAGQTMQGKQ